MNEKLIMNDNNSKLFGTDGIRGIAGQYPLDDLTIKKIGNAAAYVLKNESNNKIILIGRDTRESGERIAFLLAKEFLRMGIEVWDMGVIPTPGISYLVRKHPVLAGIVISASHNPYQDNGIKFLNPNGEKLSEYLEEKIEEKVKNDSFAFDSIKTHNGENGIKTNVSFFKEYTKYLCELLSGNLKGLKIALDCANGSTYKIAPEVMSRLGADVVSFYDNPDGKNINLNSGSLYPRNLSEKVLKQKADCGMAFDGDGDRVIFIDDKGKIRDGDYILAIASNYLKNKDKLKNNTLVTTVMSNIGLFRAMERLKINVLKTPVGDRYVFESMVKSGAIIGGEQSGHIIFRNYLSTGDGILTAIQVLSFMQDTGKPLSELCSIMEKYPQVLINVKVKEKVPIEQLPETSKIIADIERKLNNDGRVFIRYSGTENLLRVMIEGNNKDFINNLANDIAQTAKKEIEKRG